ncbi:MAG: hypothetical protein HXY40_18515 [Chloroflexi bacterium]|nr:hypothetical protein [Chloroflexota bacterium]
MIEIDTSRYSKISRGRALALLANAELIPDRFIAHKDKTFTAKFRRTRKGIFQSHHYEERMENGGDHMLAILKRPNVRIDRGPYITMRFAFAELAKLGLDKDRFAARTSNGKAPAEKAKAAPEPVDPFAFIELSRKVQDLKNLAHEANQLVKDSAKQSQLVIILQELEKHTDELLATVTGR